MAPRVLLALLVLQEQRALLQIPARQVQQVERVQRARRASRVALQIRARQVILDLRGLLEILVKMATLVKWGRRAIRALLVVLVLLAWL